MGFIDSYKHLEKLCGDVLRDDRKVSAYIDEMLNTPRGSYFVAGWDEDLKQLKHYRWIRNRISHDLGCSEENMCEPNDALWLDNFYSRIMNQTDPLALYVRATRFRQAQKQRYVYSPESVIYTYTQQTVKPKKKLKKLIACLAAIICVLVLVVVAIFVFKLLAG